MMNLIGIVGKIASGKDTVMKIIQMLGGKSNDNIDNDDLKIMVDILENDLDVVGPYENKKNSEYLKQVASLITGTHREKFEDQDFKKSRLPEQWINEELKIYTWRDFLIRIGTDAMRVNLHPNVWVNAVYANKQPHDKWIFTDVRFKNEAQRLEDEGGLLIKVSRKKSLESWLSFYNFDYYNLDGLNVQMSADEFRNEVICEPENWFSNIDWDKIHNLKDVMFHPSETDLDDYDFTHEIENNGTFTELIYKVNNLLKEIEYETA